ncbi:MAG: hypothetical protein U0792_04315 [Gemmataceae bacterium]
MDVTSDTGMLVEVLAVFYLILLLGTLPKSSPFRGSFRWCG